MACLIEKGQQELIDWTKEVLSLVISLRKRIVEEVDGSSSQNQLDDDMDDDAMREALTMLRQPSNDAMSKFEDYCIYSWFY